MGDNKKMLPMPKFIKNLCFVHVELMSSFSKHIVFLFYFVIMHNDATLLFVPPVRFIVKRSSNTEILNLSKN